MGISKFKQVQADQFLGSVYEASPFGKIWYVDVTNGSDGNLGDGPDSAFSTIGAAITAAVATRGDTVVIAPGTYTITSALAPKAYMTFRAAVVVPQTPSVSIRGNIANLMTVDVDATRFIGIEFRATGSTVRDMVNLAATTAIAGGITFEDCTWHGADTETGSYINGVAGLRAASASNAVTGLVVRRCLFRNLGKTPIEIGVKGVPLAKIEDNVFVIATPGGMGIFLDNTTAFATGKGFVIRQNDFIGNSATTSASVGIVIQGTLNTTAAGMIRENFFAYHAAAPITQAKIGSSIINNFAGAGAGGSQVAD